MWYSSLKGSFRNHSHGIRLSPPQQTKIFISGQRGYPLPPRHQRTENIINRHTRIPWLQFPTPSLTLVLKRGHRALGGGTSVISEKMSTKSKAEYSPPLPLLEICEKKKWIFSCNTLKLHYFSAPFMHLLCINDKKVITQDKPNEQNIFGTPPFTKFFIDRLSLSNKAKICNWYRMGTWNQRRSVEFDISPCCFVFLIYNLLVNFWIG